VAGKFSGWKGDFKGFFLGLRANNNKAYFEAHRRQYEDEVKAPLVALLEDLEADFGLRAGCRGQIAISAFRPTSRLTS